MNKRKEIKRLYKEKMRTAGIFQITCAASGKALIGSSLNLHGPLNRHKMELRTGIHKNRELQEDWNRLGDAAFTFETAESIEDKHDQAFSLADELELLEDIWKEKITQDPDRYYNTDMKLRQA